MKLFRTVLKHAGVYIFFLSACSGLSQAQEIPYNYILIEKFTGSWCVDCPAAVKAVDQLYANGKKIICINYQTTESRDMSMYFNWASFQRAQYYGPIYTVPTSITNGQLVLSTGISNPQDVYDKMLAKYDSCASQTTPYQVKLSSSSFRLPNGNGDSLKIKVRIDKVAQHEGKFLKLHLVLIQDHIQKKWFDLNELNHVQRNMYPSADGLSVDMSLDQSKEIDLSYYLSDKMKLIGKDVSVVAFLQIDNPSSADHKKVLQSDIRPLYLENHPIQAGFMAKRTILTPGDSTSYSPNCVGEYDRIRWEFEGGSPSQSNVSHPLVKYPDKGFYKVIVEIEKNGQTYRYQKDSAIEVFDLKIDFSADRPKVDVNKAVIFTPLPNAKIDSCEWTFLGGNPGKSSDFTPSVSFPFEGFFDVRLKVSRYNYEMGLYHTKDTLKRNCIEVIEGYIRQEINSPTSKLLFFPNPSISGIFNFLGKEELREISVYNLSGQRVLYQEHLKGALDLSNFPRGIFILKALHKGNPIQHKLVF